MYKAYLAGPDVFHPDVQAREDLLKTICGRFGVQGVFPLDGGIRAIPGEPKHVMAARIRAANLKLIRSSDLVLANVSPFRGPNADDGTAFEVGYATAFGIPVYCYSADTQELKHRPVAKTTHGASWETEDFGLPTNLMLVNKATGGIHASIEEALWQFMVHIGAKQ